MKHGADELIDLLRSPSGGLLLVVTGAGISAASGLPTFRGADPDSIWNRDDMEKATAAYFHRDPVGQWRWFLSRFDGIDSVEPNAAHFALAEIERWAEQAGRPFLLVTQNIDTLHERAGSRRLIKVHGTTDRVRCSRFGCVNGAPSGSVPLDQIDVAALRDAPSRTTLPRCAACGAPVRGHVLFFDEYYYEHEDYRFAEVEVAVARMELLLFVGTSFSVGATDLLLRAAAERGVPAFSIDPRKPSAGVAHRVRAIEARAEEILPVIAASLRAR